MGDTRVEYALEGPLARVLLDDGRVNALSTPVLRALLGAVERAEQEAGALLLLGRPGCFSAGFDLATFGAGPEAALEMVGTGAELLLRLSASSLPVVAACTGHALAMGALLLLAADARLGCSGEFKIGLNEVAIQMTLPHFALALARERLASRHLRRATLLAEIYDPAGAVEAGWLDRVVAAEDLARAARDEALRLAGLPRRAFRETKERLRADGVERLRQALEADRKLGAG